MTRRDLVVTLAFETYPDTVERGYFTPDAFVRFLLDESPVPRLLIADPWRSELSRLRRRGPRPQFPAGTGRRLISPHRLHRADPVTADAALASHRRYLRRVLAAATAEGMPAPMLVAMHPFTAAAATGWPGEVVYYGWDDWAAHPAFATSWPAYRSAYARIAGAERRVVGVAPAIVDRIGSSAGSLVLPNGLIATEWLTPARAPEWLEALPAPRVVYCGAVDSRLDLDALEALRRSRPDISIVIVGTITGDDVRDRLSRMTSVITKPHQTREQIRAIDFGADVALIPHVVSDLTRAMSPLKLYEYLAAGAPVVAIDLAPIPSLPGVFRYRTPDEFVAQVERALAHGRCDEQARLAFIEANRWESRFRTLMDFLG